MYLPHHCVPKKNNKIRLVFDCASRYEGSSLNDRCHQGPDLTNTLSSILLRFREHPYAVSGDIEAMYNQVLVPYEDRDVLRFLWFDGENIAHYRMKVHLFGGVWCSSAATYALRKTSNLQIMDKSTDYAINNLFYVGDYLASYDSSEEAFNVSMSIKSFLKSFGLNLRKLVSPNKEVGLPINTIEENCISKQLTGDGEKVLGIRWDLERDFFLFCCTSFTYGEIIF